MSSATLRRWETGDSLPSASAAAKLDALGFGKSAGRGSRAATVPRIKRGAKGMDAGEAARLRDEGMVAVGDGRRRLQVLPAPFVRNGPPDQSGFHRRLLDLQLDSRLPKDVVASRLSLAQEVAGYGPTQQHLLENPKQTAVSWNSNYGSHGWHRYVGRFPAHVVRALLNHVGADRESVVCDPFSGSGTTAVECRLLGIPFVGIEICPLSSMMTRVKAAFPSDPAVLLELSASFATFYEETWRKFVGRRDPDSLTHQAILARQGNLIRRFANIERWFTPRALLGASIAVEFGMRHEGFEREAILLALSSRMRSIGNVDVDVVRAEFSKRPREGVDVGRLVARQLVKMSGDVARSLATHAGAIESSGSISIHEASVLDVELPESSLSHVITSPPYGVEAISYLRTHLLSYRALIAHLDHDPYETRDKTIGSEFLEASGADAGREALRRSSSCRAYFAGNAGQGDRMFQQRRAAMLQFCDDMLAVGERLGRWLKRGGTVSFVIGNKRLGEDIVPLDAIITELFASCGFRLRDTLRHKLKTNNSNSQVPWQERIIQEESILIFENRK